MAKSLNKVGETGPGDCSVGGKNTEGIEREWGGREKTVRKS